MEVKFINIASEHSMTYEYFTILGNITLNDIISIANDFEVPCKINIHYKCISNNISKLDESFVYTHVRNKFIDTNCNKKVIGVTMIITKNYGKTIKVKIDINYIMD